jgi:hypothetical protein
MTTVNPWGGGQLVDLSARESLELLETSKVGRVAWCGAAGPTVIPVNYVLHDGAVWIRSTPYSMLARETAGARMAFEVDGVDESTRSGWSVLVRGRGERRPPADLPPDLPDVQAWPEGSRPFVLSIDVHEVTGKRLQAS